MKYLLLFLASCSFSFYGERQDIVNQTEYKINECSNTNQCPDNLICIKNQSYIGFCK